MLGGSCCFCRLTSRSVADRRYLLGHYISCSENIIVTYRPSRALPQAHNTTEKCIEPPHGITHIHSFAHTLIRQTTHITYMQRSDWSVPASTTHLQSAAVHALASFCIQQSHIPRVTHHTAYNFQAITTHLEIFYFPHPFCIHPHCFK